MIFGKLEFLVIVRNEEGEGVGGEYDMRRQSTPVEVSQ